MPTGSTLGALESIDASGHGDASCATSRSGRSARWSNPLCGSLGTSATFAPGKGALPTVRERARRQPGASRRHHRARPGASTSLTCPVAGAGGGMGRRHGRVLWRDAHPGDRDGPGDLEVRRACSPRPTACSPAEGCFDVQSLHGKGGRRRRPALQGGGESPSWPWVGSMDEALLERGPRAGRDALRARQHLEPAAGEPHQEAALQAVPHGRPRRRAHLRAVKCPPTSRRRSTDATGPFCGRAASTPNGPSRQPQPAGPHGRHTRHRRRPMRTTPRNADRPTARPDTNATGNPGAAVLARRRWGPLRRGLPGAQERQQEHQARAVILGVVGLIVVALIAPGGVGACLCGNHRAAA